MVEGKGGDKSAEGGSVHDEKQRTKNGALGNATGASIEGEKVLLHLTQKERDDKYDSNQLRTEPWRPNQDDRRVSIRCCGRWYLKQQRDRGDTYTTIVVILLH